MSDDSMHETTVYGNVGKLTNIGTVNGNVLIINETVTQEAIGRLTRNISPSPAAYPSADITNHIKVIAKSTRFGNKVQFHVPHDMPVGVFTNLVTNVLKLPASVSLDDFMIALTFRYALVFKNEELSPNKTLREIGILDGDEIEVAIATEWSDKLESQPRIDLPVVRHFGGTGKGGLSELADFARMMANNRDSQMQEPPQVTAARKARGTITREKIESWANGFFKYIDEIGSQ